MTCRMTNSSGCLPKALKNQRKANLLEHRLHSVPYPHVQGRKEKNGQENNHLPGNHERDFERNEMCALTFLIRNPVINHKSSVGKHIVAEFCICRYATQLGTGNVL